MHSSVNNTMQSVQDVSEMEPVAHSVQSSSRTFQIYSSSPDTSMLLDIEKPLTHINSLNQERVLDAQNQRTEKLASILDREICVEDICLHPRREKMLPEEHQGHRTVKYSELIQKLSVLQCNRHLAEKNQQQTIELLDGIDRVYHAIVDFQDEITRLFQKIKQDALNHVTTVKQSFYSTHHDRIRKQLHQYFDYATVKHALVEIERFKLVEYPTLDYPRFKVGSMQKRIGLASVNYKLIGIQAVNSWIQRLYALDKRDKRVIYNRSITSFLNKSTSEKPLFSYYLKDSEYAVSNSGKILTRPQCRNEDVPFAVIEKEILTGTEIKFKVINVGKGMFIGISSLGVIQAKKRSSRKPYQNLVFQSGSYYLTNRGDVLPQDKKRHLSQMDFTTGDEITLKRENNSIFWMRKRHEKIEQVKVTLSITEYAQPLYPCVHMVDSTCILEIMD